MAAKGTALATAAPQQNTALNPIVGTALEKVEAFRQISANLAASGLEVNGWRESKEILAACWMADSLLVNPITYMQGNWVMNMGGKKVIEPKWDFMVALLQSRIPGFRWKVVQETEVAAEVWMSDGNGNEHTVLYTMADAVRQGHTKKNALYATSSREMLLAKAVKRCGKRIGAHVLAGMAAYEPEYDAQEGVQRPAGATNSASMAEVLEDGLEGQQEPPAASEDPIKALVAEIENRWGKLAPQKLGQTINEIAKVALSGTQFQKWDDMGPADARLMLDYVRTKYAGPAVPVGTPPKPPATTPVAAPAPAPAPAHCTFPDCTNEATGMAKGLGADSVPWCDEHMPAIEDEPVEDGPALDDEPAPEPAPVDDVAAAGQRMQDDVDADLGTLVGLLDRAAKHPKFGRPLARMEPLVKDGPAIGLWMKNAEIQKAHGLTRATLLGVEEGGQGLTQRVEPEMCRRYCRWIREQGVA